MDDWKPPFPFDAQRIRQKDEDYWDEYRGTPKAFVSLAEGRSLWASRFGQTTTLSVDVAQPPPAVKDLAENDSRGRPSHIDGDLSNEAFETRLAAILPADQMGLAWQPVRWRSLEASDGTTSFNLLFLGFSFFIIVSALMLVVLLFRLGVDLRRRQIGTLLALGWTGRRITLVLLAEGAIVAALGSIVGMVLGIAYAWLMVLGLRTWWLAAIATPFLRLHVTAGSLALGLVTGLILSVAAIGLSVRRAGRVPVRLLMSGTPPENLP
ncbi:MAG TPA: hypothetical protein DD670_08010, partial [Planctomycetaceae bacterium]|nr:hypothetical protein [Planctomycetaceae bacterium]